MMTRLLCALLLGLLPVAASAQPAPMPSVPTSTGTLNGVGDYCWNGSSVVMCPAALSSLTITSLDAATVTTGGTAVTALNAGHRNKGGWIQNPPSASVNLCINETTTASGTTSSGNTTCIVPGQTYNLVPSANAVSVISSDSSHAFSGFGLN